MDDLAFFSNSSNNHNQQQQQRHHQHQQFNPISPSTSSTNMSSSTTSTPRGAIVYSHSHDHPRDRPQLQLPIDLDALNFSQIPNALLAPQSSSNPRSHPYSGSQRKGSLQSDPVQEALDFEQRLGLEMPSFQNTMSTFDHVHDHNHQPIERTNLFASSSQQPSSRSKPVTTSTKLQRIPSYNSAFDDPNQSFLSTSSSIEYPRSAPAPTTAYQTRTNAMNINILSPSNSHNETHSFGFARSGMRNANGNVTGNANTTLGDDKSLYIGTSPTSTKDHHISQMTNGLGVNGWVRKGTGKDMGEDEDEEFDGDRSVEGLIKALQSSDYKSLPRNSGSGKLPTSYITKSLFECHNPKSSHQQPQQTNLKIPYKPMKPSPLKQSPTTRTVSTASTTGISAGVGGGGRVGEEGEGEGGRKVSGRGKKMDIVDEREDEEAETRQRFQSQSQSQSQTKRSVSNPRYDQENDPISVSFKNVDTNEKSQERSRRVVSGSGSINPIRGEQPRQLSTGTKQISQHQQQQHGYQDTPVPIRSRNGLSSTSLLEMQENGKRGNHAAGSSSPMMMRNMRDGEDGRDRENGKELGSSPSVHRVRIVSGDMNVNAAAQANSNARTQRQPPQPQQQRSTTLTSDLTRLTDLCKTPGRGDSFRDVGENAGGRKGKGAQIPMNLKAITNQMNQLAIEKDEAKEMIRNLQTDLEKRELEVRENQREGQGWRLQYEEVVRERQEFETLLQAAQSKLAQLERIQAEEVERKVSSVRGELLARLTPRKPERAVSSHTTVSQGNKASSSSLPMSQVDLRGVLQNVMDSMNTVALEIDGIKKTVNEAIGIRQASEAERSFREARQDRPISEAIERSVRPEGKTQSLRGKASQYSEGIRSAAYDTSMLQNDPTPAPETISTIPAPAPTTAQTPLITTVETETESEGGHASPSPLSSAINRSISHASPCPRNEEEKERERSRCHRERRASKMASNTSACSARSDEPQEDPSMEAFPAIRGDKNEREFFDISKQANIGRENERVRTGRSQRPQRRVDQETGNRTGRTALPVTPASSSDGEPLPAVSQLISVLKELEDDYHHYLHIFSECSDRYKRLAPTDTKRNILSEHVREVMILVDQKANQVARLTASLQISGSEQQYRAPLMQAVEASKRRMELPSVLQGVMKEMREEMNVDGRQEWAEI